MKKNKAYIISSTKLSGDEQMALDLNLLNKTILNEEILYTLRFYFWDGYWLSIGYHQKKIPSEWLKLSEAGQIKIVRRPSGGGAVLHSGGITYALTSKKKLYKEFNYEVINNWLIESFSKLDINLQKGKIQKSTIKENCFSSSFTCDLIDDKGNKRIGSAQYWKKGSFLQHGEIQLNPPKDLWLSLFKDTPPNALELKINSNQLIDHLRDNFLKSFNHKETNTIFCSYDQLLKE